MGFVKERYDYSGDRLGFVAPGLDLGPPEVTDAGMENGFESFAGGGVYEDTAGKFVAAELPVGADNIRAERFFNLNQSGLARLDDRASENVCVNDRNATGAEEVRGG
jgi:hypothetical protein